MKLIIPCLHLSASCLHLRSFNDTLRTVHTLLHVFEENYSIIFSWVKLGFKRMWCVSSMLHGCLKCAHKDLIHIIPIDDHPFSHCNHTQIPIGILIPFSYFIPTSVAPIFSSPSSWHFYISHLFKPSSSHSKLPPHQISYGHVNHPIALSDSSHIIHYSKSPMVAPIKD